jgi:hypothetical protein
MRRLVSSTPALTGLSDNAGDRARVRFLEFFTANIRTPRTRRGYARGVTDFLAWCERVDVASFVAVQPLHGMHPASTPGRRAGLPRRSGSHGGFGLLVRLPVPREQVGDFFGGVIWGTWQARQRARPAAFWIRQADNVWINGLQCCADVVQGSCRTDRHSP